MKVWVAIALFCCVMLFGGAIFYAINYSPGGNWGGFYKSNNREVTVIFSSGGLVSFYSATPYSPVTGSTSKYYAQLVKCKKVNGQLLVYRTDQSRQHIGALYAKAKVVGYRRLEFTFQQQPAENGPTRIVMKRLSTN